ncbi:MAG: OmpH family outer membrane protein [Flavobacterium sp.]
MKKLIVLLMIPFLFASCANENSKATTSTNNDFKTAYVDTQKLMEENLEAKDIRAKFESMLEEKGKRFDAEVKQFQQEAANFEKNAQQYGMQWAQTKGNELRQREQYLAQQEQLIMREAQFEGGKEMDSLVKRIRTFIKDYAKEKDYDYVFGTGESANVLFAKDAYNITDEIATLLNDKYKPTGKKEEVEKTEDDKK